MHGYLIDVDRTGPSLSYVDAYDALVAYDALARALGAGVSIWIADQDEWIELTRDALYSASVDYTDVMDY